MKKITSAYSVIILLIGVHFSQGTQYADKCKLGVQNNLLDDVGEDCDDTSNSNEL